MPSKNKIDIDEIVLEAHRRGVERAIDLSIRTGTPLIVEENGKIREIMPKYKYVLVPIEPKSEKSKHARKIRH